MTTPSKAYVERLNGKDDPQAGAHAALVEALDNESKLSDPLGDSPISTSKFFASYAQKYQP